MEKTEQNVGEYQWKEKGVVDQIFTIRREELYKAMIKTAIITKSKEELKNVVWLLVVCR